MANFIESTLELIGNTPLLKLNNYSKKAGVKNATILAKLEYLNPAIRKVSISHYEYLYSQYPVQKSIVCQYIDTSEEQVVKSLEGKKKSVSEGQVVSENGSSTRNNDVLNSTSKLSLVQTQIKPIPLQGAERQMPFYKKKHLPFFDRCFNL